MTKRNRGISIISQIKHQYNFLKVPFSLKVIKMQQLNSLIDFYQLKSQNDTSNAFKKAQKYINSTEKGEVDKQITKRRAHQFLKFIHAYLNSQDGSPESKFYTLSIIKLATVKDERTILSVLSNHALFRYLVALAKSTDPELPINQKGKKLFPDPKIGNDYIRLILESIRVWGERFSSNKKNESSRYKKAYDELLKIKIVMPKDLIFYDSRILLTINGTKNTGLEPGEINISQRISRIGQEEPLNSDQTQNTKIMQYDINQIQEFIKKLEQSEYQKYCHEYHKLFLKQPKKYESIVNNLISGQNQKQLHAAIAINDFYLQQSQAYERFLTKNEDYYSYVNFIQLKADQLFSNTKKTLQIKEVVKKQVSAEVKNFRKDNLVSNLNQAVQNKSLISELKTKINSQAKVKYTSFNSIKQLLSKDKSLSRGRSISGAKKSSLLTLSKSISKSRISQIFFDPPNPNPQDKRYQGERITINRDLERTMREITRNQGHRRFITSCFKNKNPLFQNNHIQIGFKSEAIYEQVNEFQAILSIELFIGNKTEYQVKNLQLDYKGQANVLLYGNPKNVQSYLFPGVQTKQQLLIAPLGNKFSLIKMYMTYEINSERHEQKIILPNSILKFSENKKLSKKQFVQHWNCSTIYKTDEFRLSKYIAPQSLGKYIEMLQELSVYDKFIEPGSETDYEVGCEVILNKKYEAVLRISVRPNLNAVIQIGITSINQQAYEAFINYAQILQMILSIVKNM